MKPTQREAISESQYRPFLSSLVLKRGETRSTSRFEPLAFSGRLARSSSVLGEEGKSSCFLARGSEMSVEVCRGCCFEGVRGGKEQFAYKLGAKFWQLRGGGVYREAGRTG